MFCVLDATIWQKNLSIPNTTDPAEPAHETNSSPQSKKSAKTETYTPQHALELFNTYTEKDDETVIATEGFEKLCTDANIPFDGVLPLILAWQMEAKEMGRITKDEWVKGTSSLRYVTMFVSRAGGIYDMR